MWEDELLSFGTSLSTSMVMWKEGKQKADIFFKLRGISRWSQDEGRLKPHVWTVRKGNQHEGLISGWVENQRGTLLGWFPRDGIAVGQTVLPESQLLKLQAARRRSKLSA